MSTGSPCAHRPIIVAEDGPWTVVGNVRWAAQREGLFGVGDTVEQDYVHYSMGKHSGL
jgi:hypothetical protein